MSDGTSETSLKTKLKKKTPKVKEIEATMSYDNKIVYEEGGETKEYSIDSMEDLNWAVNECAVTGKNAFEVSNRLFDLLAHGIPTPFIIKGNPAVYIYREGTMEKTQTLMSLDIDDVLELKAKKARKEAEEAKAKKEKFKAEIEL